MFRAGAVCAVWLPVEPAAKAVALRGFMTARLGPAVPYQELALAVESIILPLPAPTDGLQGRAASPSPRPLLLAKSSTQTVSFRNPPHTPSVHRDIFAACQALPAAVSVM